MFFVTKYLEATKTHRPKILIGSQKRVLKLGYNMPK